MILGLLLTFLGGIGAEWLRQGTSRRAAEGESNINLEKHRAQLTFELLSAAHAEVRTLREEITRLRPLEAHIIQFEEALYHIENLLTAQDTVTRDQAERDARTFLGKVRVGIRS